MAIFALRAGALLRSAIDSFATRAPTTSAPPTSTSRLGTSAAPSHVHVTPNTISSSDSSATSGRGQGAGRGDGDQAGHRQLGDTEQGEQRHVVAGGGTAEPAGR